MRRRVDDSITQGGTLIQLQASEPAVNRNSPRYALHLLAYTVVTS